jgi:hypothetical protein
VRNKQNEGEEEEKENKSKKETAVRTDGHVKKRKPSTFFGRILPYSILGSTPIAKTF